MRIWLVTIGEPLPVPPTTKDRLHRTGLFAEVLAANGCDVTWWTSTFNHFHKQHYYEHDETVLSAKGLEIVMLHGGGYESNVSLSRIRDHRQIARKFATAAPSKPRPDIIFCSYPTIELSLAAVWYGERHRVPVVLDMRDMWPDIFADHVPYMLRPAARLMAAQLCRAPRRACAGATAITGITDAFVDWGLAKGKRHPSRHDKAFPMAYVSRSLSETQLADAEGFWDNFGLNRDKNDFTVCFIGAIGHQFDLSSVISAGRKINRSDRRIRFVLCGTGDRVKHFQASAAGLSNMLFPGWVDAAKIFVLMRRSSVGLDPLPDRYDYRATINNKAIEYMSAGLPVLSSPQSGVLHGLLQIHECGASYPAGDANALAETLARLHDDRETLRMMSQNAARLFQERFTAEKVYTEMMAHLMGIAEDYKQNQSIGGATNRPDLRA